MTHLKAQASQHGAGAARNLYFCCMRASENPQRIRRSPSVRQAHHSDHTRFANALPGQTGHRSIGASSCVRLNVSCAAVPGEGHTNRPWCRRRAASQIPMPSCTRTFMRLALRFADSFVDTILLAMTTLHGGHQRKAHGDTQSDHVDCGSGRNC